jgi:hypothetical protein
MKRNEDIWHFKNSLNLIGKRWMFAPFAAEIDENDDI